MFDTSELQAKAKKYLSTLCVDIGERCVGFEGNRNATHFFNNILNSYSWKTEMPEFNAIDWADGGATMKFSDADFNVLVSPYSLSCNLSSKLVDATNISELGKEKTTGDCLRDIKKFRVGRRSVSFSLD